MNDRFNFRAWDKKNNQMVPWIDNDDYGYYGSPEYENYDFDGNDRFIVMQSTGLRDKNGVLIYESDIIEFVEENFSDHGFPPFSKGTKCVVCWDDFHAGFGLYTLKTFESRIKMQKICTGSDMDMNYYGLVSVNQEIPIGAYSQVIGSIHENSELLNQ